MIGLTLIKTTLDEKLPQTGGITQTFNDLNVNSAHFPPPPPFAGRGVQPYSLILLYDTTVVLIKKKKKKIIPHPNCLLICQEHMLREVKIHDSALLPKVQFNPGRKGRAGGRQRGRRRTGRFFFFFL